VALSSLAQLPLVAKSLGPDRTIAVLGAIAPPLTENFIKTDCRIDVPNTLVCYGLQGEPAFARFLKESGIPSEAVVAPMSVTPSAVAADLVAVSRRLVQEHPDTGAILFECANFAPYTSIVQEAIGLPVFDIVTMIDLLHSVSNTRRPVGFL
jgi:hypothetical protein